MALCNTSNCELSFTLPSDLTIRLTFHRPFWNIGRSSSQNTPFQYPLSRFSRLLPTIRPSWRSVRVPGTGQCASPRSVPKSMPLICNHRYRSPYEWHDANYWFGDTWFTVGDGDESVAALYPERSLFLSWPMPESPMVQTIEKPAVIRCSISVTEDHQGTNISMLYSCLSPSWKIAGSVPGPVSRSA